MRRRDRLFFSDGGDEGGEPGPVEQACADIAAVFHWPPEVMAAMTLDELMMWQSLAIDRFEKMRKAEG
ncbi:GpE family phage tail protein [Sphingomonas kyeonggiensis]|uniref:GpE family phage tail protein n=1 Tax=Sphingomonas kyeonggiensis TaxID=1268553 RepID=UPI0027D8EBEC|nr:GpE family phage tail protein [Sphingomonas kyeonggiensis]